ncbi:MAG: UDP-N-acetylglucosamine 1-carboxyvinyltransferase, partial [Bacteroidales bacterium]|nr:UDP-N-acetylglucosamine 1-carboxyvinyltransferase [Bacteroidales bacterium]
MAVFRITGGKKLCGDLYPQGAKNEALQVLSAVLLTKEPIIIRNIPKIRDVMNLIELLMCLGVKVTQLKSNEYRFQADDVNIEYLTSKEFQEKSKTLRGSIMLVGPLLARFGKGFISSPGGDKIGRRRLDTHFIGFQNLGAQFSFNQETSMFTVSSEHLKGTYMLLDEASVTGTANIVMAAVMAEGTTTIYNAACEPYVQQLCKMLNKMGAKISGIASNLLTIEGVESLGGCEHTILPDMIEVGSFMGLAAM